MTPGPENGGRVRVFPLHQLPSGFLRFLDEPPDPPAFPRPSATLVLLREGRAALEVLLLKRSPRSGFIPGAWVFPGGTVDPEDGDPGIFSRLHGITPEIARDRLRPSEPEPPSLAYWVAALRETFEETGVLLRRRGSGNGLESSDQTKAETLARSKLLAGAMSFKNVLETLEITLDAGALEYHGHWLTPECEPRRYDTRFFAAEVGKDARVTPHEKEMVEAHWLTPADALTRNREGTLPLVFPTLFTLEELQPFKTPREALGFLRGRPVPRRLPILERTEIGIGFHLPD
ncbi:MAG: NUDIX domain-containing protein [Gemmatimonadota bacterium]